MQSLSVSFHPEYQNFHATPDLHRALALIGLLDQMSRIHVLYTLHNSKQVLFKGYDQCDAFGKLLQAAHKRANRVTFNILPLPEEDPRKWAAVNVQYFEKEDPDPYCIGKFRVSLSEGQISILAFGEPKK